MLSASEGIFERTSEEDTEIDGITYKKGTYISYYLKSVYCNPNTSHNLWNLNLKNGFNKVK